MTLDPTPTKELHVGDARAFQLEGDLAGQRRRDRGVPVLGTLEPGGRGHGGRGWQRGSRAGVARGRQAALVPSDRRSAGVTAFLILGSFGALACLALSIPAVVMVVGAGVWLAASSKVLGRVG